MKIFHISHRTICTTRMVFLTNILFVMLNSCQHFSDNRAELSVISLKNIPRSTISYTESDKGGNTSIAFDADSKFKWSGKSPYRSGGVGYYLPDGTEVPYIKRDRDMGQTFTYTANVSKEWKSVVIQTGFGDNVVRSEMYGKNISLQLFEVTGNLMLNENNSTGKMSAFHGYPHHRDNPKMTAEKDDYFEGEKYTSIQVISGYKFPSPIDFGIDKDEKKVQSNNKKLKGQYLQFNIPSKERPVLRPGKKYAFLILVDSIGNNRGFTVANRYYGNYDGGHAIRRDGNGVFPPVPANPQKDFSDPVNKPAMEAGHFPKDLKMRTAISPSTNGYPDVDTWRDLVFFIQTKPI